MTGGTMFNLENTSIRWKTAIPIILVISVGVLLTVIITGLKTKEIVLDELKQSSMMRVSDTVLNSLVAIRMRWQHIIAATWPMPN